MVGLPLAGTLALEPLALEPLAGTLALEPLSMGTLLAGTLPVHILLMDTLLVDTLLWQLYSLRCSSCFPPVRHRAGVVI
jgi:hypothetical protein